MRDLVVEKVVEGVWCLRRRSYATCSYLVARADGLVLVDTGMDSDAGDVAAGLRAADGDWSDIRAIVVTHWHNDHAAGAAVAQQRSGAPVYCGRAEVPFVRRASRRPGVLGAIGDRWPERGPLVLAKGVLTNAPRRAVDEPSTIDDGDEVAGLEIVVTPGHTAGHLSVWDPSARTLFSGDGLAVVGGEIRRMARAVTPDREAAGRSMRRLLDLEPVVVCPGHRRPMSVTAGDLAAARRALDHERWPHLG